MTDRIPHAVPILLIAFVIRVLGAVVTTLTTINPDSTADAVAFGNTAAVIARGIRVGQPYLYTSNSINLYDLLVPVTSVDIYTLWGTFLAPFWLLPGPSGFYARLGNALLGAFAIYNVYIVTRYLHSHHAGVVASFPMMFYLSFVAGHSTLLREAMVLFGITTALRLMLIPSEQRSRLLSYALAGVALHISLLLRNDNIVIFAVAIGSGLLLYAVQLGYVSRPVIALGMILSPVAFLVSLPVLRSGVEFLAYIRRIRAYGRAVYLPEAIPRTILELIAFSWVGAAYFLYAPFPWMVETVPDLLISIEGLINIGFTIFAIWGVRSLAGKNLPATVGLLAGLAVAVVLYGVGTANYGTGMRHRQMFLWVIFLFGGIGFTERVRLVWPFEWGCPSTVSGTEQPSSRSD